MASDRKAQLELIGVVALLVVLGLFIQPLLKGGSSGSSTGAASPASLTATADAGSSTASGPAMAQESRRDGPTLFAAAQEPHLDPSYTAGELRDPLKSLLPRDADQSAAQPSYANQVPSQRQPPLMNVQGVIWGGKAPQAVIDGQVYGVGDTVKDARIVSITRNGITLDMGGMTFNVSPEPMASEPRAGAHPQYSYQHP